VAAGGRRQQLQEAVAARTNRRICTKWMVAVGACLLLLATTAKADDRVEMIPSFTLVRAYDDNVFGSPDGHVADAIWRLSPSLAAGYESDPVTAQGYYTFDAERYTHNPGLDSNEARRHVALNLGYHPGPVWSINLDGDYFRTNTPSELVPLTGLQLGRFGATLTSVTPSMNFQLNPLFSISASAGFTKDELDQGVEADVHSATLDLDHKLDPLDTAGLDYTYYRYLFNDASSFDSQLFSLSWAHSLSALSGFGLHVGRRTTAGSVTPEIVATFSQTLEHGDFGVNYDRSQNVVIGLKGTVQTRALGAAATYSVTPDIQFRLSPAAAINSYQGTEAKADSLGFQVNYRVKNSVWLVAGYQFNREAGVLAGPANEKIIDNMIFLGLNMSFTPGSVAAGPQRPTFPFKVLEPNAMMIGEGPSAPRSNP
jgi:hypothetical protein